MGRKLDLSGLTEHEAEHVLQVVQRDMRLRKKEEERLSELKQELEEEGSRCLLLSRRRCFNQRCCIRCCSPFTFLLNPKRQCRDCCYNICKACRVYNKRDKAWLCSACQKSRLLKTQSLEWFYTNVKKRFKRFGSSKVLKTLYRKHLAEHNPLSELTEGSAYEESVCNEGSVCGSDSTFYRQTEEHSMAETLGVALRVAEEAIDEAISKAEFDTASQEKQNEAQYLREHRAEVIEELAKIIVQKIISRRKTLADMRAEYDQDWSLEHNIDLRHRQMAHDQASSSSKQQTSLWRSHSAFSLLDNDDPGLLQDSPQALKKEGGGSAMSTWKSVDRLDNAMLKSPDGNWIALQSAQLSRPSLLTKRKSLVFSALERESEVVSAYEGMGSDNESKPEPDCSWGAALHEFQRKMTDSNFSPQDRTPSSLTSPRGSREDLFSDSEGNWQPDTSLLALFKRKVPAEIRRPLSSCRTNIIDVNFNMEGAGQEGASEPKVGKVKRSHKKRKSKKESALQSSALDYSKTDNLSQDMSDAVTPDTLTSGATTPEPFDRKSDIAGRRANQMDRELTSKLQQLAGRVSDSSTEEEDVDGVTDAAINGRREENRQGSENRDEEGERLWRMEIDLDEGRTADENEDEEDLKCRLYRLIAQSRLTYFSSTDDLSDRVGRSGGEWEGDGTEDVGEENKEQQDGEKTDGLTYKLCQLEKEVGANQFSSTEDELDRVGVWGEEKKTGEEEEEEEKEELAVKVCRLANQVSATQFSSTEDELDRAGGGGEGLEEESLWKLEAENAVQAAQLHGLASSVGASQFSPTQEVNEGGIESCMWEEAVGKSQRGRESFRDLDVRVFDLRDGRTENGQTKDIQGKLEVEKDCKDERVVTEGKRKGLVCEDKVEVLKVDKIGKAKEGEERQKRQELELKTVVEGARTEEIMGSHETKENQPEAKWPDEEGREEDKIREGKESEEKRAAEDSDEEEDAEFNRIISSMLMMTLEDMQGEMLHEAGERINGEPEEGETDEKVKSERQSGFNDTAAVSPDASEETGSAKEFQSHSGNAMPGVREGVGGIKTEPIQGHGSRKKESGDVTGGRENEQHEKYTNPQEKKTLTERNEDKQTCRRVEGDDDKEEEERGRVAAGTDSAQGGRHSKETDGRLEETQEGKADDMEDSSTSSLQGGFLSPEEIKIGSDMELYKTIQFLSTLLEQRYSAVSLRSITTEVLRVLNATEDLLQGAEGGDDARPSSVSLPLDTDHKKLEQQFSRLEENVYVAAGAVYSLEAELTDLEECARGVCSTTSDMELSFLEEQVASAAAKVQQSDLQVCDISARIAALKSAGLNVDTQSRSKTKTIPVMVPYLPSYHKSPVTLDSSRQLRRRLPAPPVKEDKEA